MTLTQRFHLAIITAAFGLGAPLAAAQARPSQQPGAPNASQPGTPNSPRLMTLMPHQLSSAPTSSPSVSTTAASAGVLSPGATAASAKPSPSVPATPESPAAAPRTATAHSLLDEPATPAKILVSGDRLSITAANASLSEVIRQVANDTGMQVEGNSRDQRVFGTYGPGSPPEVLSALLYDSGYNVIMVGSTAEGAPRRLVLSTRSAASAVPGAPTQAKSSDEDDEEPPAVEVASPPPPPNPGVITAPGAVPSNGQPKTPQQMLEELQRMHQGQQPTDLPHDNNN